MKMESLENGRLADSLEAEVDDTGEAYGRPRTQRKHNAGLWAEENVEEEKFNDDIGYGDGSIDSSMEVEADTQEDKMKRLEEEKLKQMKTIQNMDDLGSTSVPQLINSNPFLRDSKGITNSSDFHNRSPTGTRSNNSSPGNPSSGLLPSINNSNFRSPSLNPSSNW